MSLLDPCWSHDRPLAPVRRQKIHGSYDGPPFTYALPAPTPALHLLVCLDFFGCGTHDFALSHSCLGLRRSLCREGCCLLPRCFYGPMCNYSLTCLAHRRQVRRHSHILLQHALLPRGLVLAHCAPLVRLRTESSSRGPQIPAGSKAKYLLHLEKTNHLLLFGVYKAISKSALNLFQPVCSPPLRLRQSPRLPIFQRN